MISSGPVIQVSVANGKIKGRRFLVQNLSNDDLYYTVFARQETQQPGVYLQMIK